MIYILRCQCKCVPGKLLIWCSSKYRENKNALKIFCILPVKQGNWQRRVRRRLPLPPNSHHEPILCFALGPYRWRKKFAGLGVAEVRRLKQLEAENKKLKGLVADLSPNKRMLQDVLSKKVVRPAPRREVAKALQMDYGSASAGPFERQDSPAQATATAPLPDGQARKVA